MPQRTSDQTKAGHEFRGFAERLSLSFFPLRPTGCPDNHDADGFCLSLPVVIQKSDESFETTSKSVVQVLTTHQPTLAYNDVQVTSSAFSRGCFTSGSFSTHF